MVTVCGTSLGFMVSGFMWSRTGHTSGGGAAYLSCSCRSWLRRTPSARHRNVGGLGPDQQHQLLVRVGPAPPSRLKIQLISLGDGGERRNVEQTPALVRILKMHGTCWMRLSCGWSHLDQVLTPSVHDEMNLLDS